MSNNGSLAVMEANKSPATKHSAQPPDLARALFKDIRISVSMVAGLEAIANKAIDDGETSVETLEHIALIAKKVREELSSASLTIAELNGTH